MVRVQSRIDEIVRKKRDAPQRSGSTKVSAPTSMKQGVKTWVVSETLNIPMRTLQEWKKASKESGNWDALGGLSRPAKRKADPGSGSGGRKVSSRMMKRIKDLLDINPFMTPVGLQQRLPGLRDVSLRTIQRVILKDLKIPSRLATKKPHHLEAQKAQRLDCANRHRHWSRVKWARVLFSDETHVEHWNGAQQCRRVRRSCLHARRSNSPDCNPIENLWVELKKIVRTYPTASNLDELRRNVRAWKQLGCDT